MKNNYFTKLREHKRTYDFAELAWPKARLFVKKRSHKRSRRQLDREMVNEMKMESIY